MCVFVICIMRVYMYVCTLWEIMMVKEKLILVCSESRVSGLSRDAHNGQPSFIIVQPKQKHRYIIVRNFVMQLKACIRFAQFLSFVQ